MLTDYYLILCLLHDPDLRVHTIRLTYSSIFAHIHTHTNTQYSIFAFFTCFNPTSYMFEKTFVENITSRIDVPLHRGIVIKVNLKYCKNIKTEPQEL